MVLDVAEWCEWCIMVWDGTNCTLMQMVQGDAGGTGLRKVLRNGME